MAQQLTAEEERGAVFLECLEVCVHTILCLREVYPREAFTRHRAFGVPVLMSRHPDLNSYIAEVLQSARGLVEANGVEKVSLCILEGHRAVERYSFELHAGGCDDLDDVDAVNDTVYGMRALLMKLQVMDDQLPKPPRDSTFTILLHSRNDDDLKSFLADGATTWVDATDEAIARDHDPANSSVWPVKQVCTPLADFSLNVYYTRPTSSPGFDGL